jgi:hypothetical protein
MRRSRCWRSSRATRSNSEKTGTTAIGTAAGHPHPSLNTNDHHELERVPALSGTPMWAPADTRSRRCPGPVN